MDTLSSEKFEAILSALCETLTSESRRNAKFESTKPFETRIRKELAGLLSEFNVDIDFAPHPHIFPDVVLGKFGIEIKFTEKDTWRSIANSVFESTRSETVEQIYVVFGKMGGEPGVRWGKYDDCVIHVRTSHVPRFEVEMLARESLFTKIGVPYAEFSKLDIPERMKHIREYARGRLREGERLWWLEDAAEHEQTHSLPLHVRLYMRLPQEEKRKLRAEAALLCPSIVKPSRSKNKYNDAVIYLLTYHGVLCPQARDLFSAGSVALRSNPKRGGNYIARALDDIVDEMRAAARDLEEALFIEYWGYNVAPARRIREWLKLADERAVGWKPSKVLFIK